MKNLDPNTITLTPQQLLEITERHAAEYHRLGHLDSPTPTEEDIWTMLEALNWTLWLTPNHGHAAVELLREKLKSSKH